MTFYNDQFMLVEDSHNNIYMFQWKDRHINLFIFNYITEKVEKKTIVKNAHQEYDVFIDDFDNIYIVYQDINYNLHLLILEGNEKGKIEFIEKPRNLIYNLNVLNHKGYIHVFYCIKSSSKVGIYEIYHNLYNGKGWIINKIGEIKTLKLLNPINIIKAKDKILLSYYNYIDKKEIYLKSYNTQENIWEEEFQLTNSGKYKLYLDFIIIEDKINLVYSEETDGNFVIKYKRLVFENSIINKEVEERISNPENSSHPIIIYYEEKIWIIWLEYNNLLSRFSDDGGDNWSPIYLWKEMKNENIIKYKYINNKDIANKILNNSFGKMYPEISFIGFGPLLNVTEIPLKKNKIIF